MSAAFEAEMDGGAAAVVWMGVVASGSVMFVSWDVLMVELSKRELASGDKERHAEAGGESYVASSVSLELSIDVVRES